MSLEVSDEISDHPDVALRLDVHPSRVHLHADLVHAVEHAALDPLGHGLGEEKPSSVVNF